MTTPQTSRDGDIFNPEPIVRLGQGAYVREWPDPNATIDLDERPGMSDGLFRGLVWMTYGMVIASAGWATYIWST